MPNKAPEPSSGQGIEFKTNPYTQHFLLANSDGSLFSILAFLGHFTQPRHCRGILGTPLRAVDSITELQRPSIRDHKFFGGSGPKSFVTI